MNLIKERRSVRTFNVEQMTKEDNITWVVCNNLCLACGTCVSICPQEAIRMVETPAGLLVAQADDSKCSGCGLCLECCPGTHLEQGLLSAEFDPFKGKAVAVYLGQALDQRILSEGQSGGIVTALLCHLLDSGCITGAIVTQMPEDGSLRPKSIVARDKSTICRAQGSKYCPVAVNSVIPKEVDDGEKLAVVGLPCHIHGIRNVQSRLGRWQGLFTIGLVCERILAFGAIDHLIDKAHLSRSDVTYFRFKSKLLGGWPGDIYIRTRDSVVHRLPKWQRSKIKDVYTPLRCRLCFDRLNVLSDLVVGDPWGIRKDKEGYSIVIVRSERAKDALLSSQSTGSLRLWPIEPELVFKGQSVEQKRQEWTEFTKAWSHMGGIVPESCIDKRWVADVRNIKLKPYCRKLVWARYFSRIRNTSDVLRFAKRELVFQKFRFALKDPARVLRRITAKLRKRSHESTV